MGRRQDDGGWDFSGGQGWSLAAETTQGLTRGTEILPATIDPQYEAGFVWTRQYSFRMSKDFGKKFFLGASAENAETLNPAGQGLPSNYALRLGRHRRRSLQRRPPITRSTRRRTSWPRSRFEPGWGHWEFFGIERNFRDRIYPNRGIGNLARCRHVHDSTAHTTMHRARASAAASAVRWSDNKVTIGLKGLWGKGMGRYGSSTIADITLRPDAQISPIHGFSALSTVELNPTPNFNMYFNYGGD